MKTNLFFHLGQGAEDQDPLDPPIPKSASVPKGCMTVCEAFRDKYSLTPFRHKSSDLSIDGGTGEGRAPEPRPIKNFNGKIPKRNWANTDRTLLLLICLR